MGTEGEERKGGGHGAKSAMVKAISGQVRVTDVRLPLMIIAQPANSGSVPDDINSF